MTLDEQGILVATGSACAANKETESHVLVAMGLASELRDGSLRLTIGASQTSQECEYVAQLIIKNVQMLRELN
jgi:cysteine desulfurase